jgi:aldehyde dehydrogenase (NAD+)
MYVNGLWRESVSQRWLLSADPWAQADWAQVPEGDGRDVDEAVRAARDALADSSWRHSPRARGTVLRHFADLVDANCERLAEVESRDNGKTLREARAGFRNAGEYFRHAASIAEAVTDSAPAGGNPDVAALTRRVPYGVIGIQTPWNTPGVILAQSAAPALAAGNSIVIKPPELAPCSTLELAGLADQAGFPPGIINVVTGYGPVVGAALCAHPGVDKLVFTGSPEAGVLVAAAAARRLIPSTLELGGKSAHIVFPEADLDRAASGIVRALVGAGGQSCMCGSRALVHESIYDQVEARVLAELQGVILGDPRDPRTDMGPLCTSDQVARVTRYVQTALDEGGRIIAGGGPPPGIDHPLFITPTVVAGLKPDATLCQEEVFGPVLALLRFSTEDEAVRIANGTPFGLAAMIWTTSLDRAHRVSDAVHAGVVFVNHYRSGDPAFANGGMGRSGYGRVSGVEGYQEMTQLKSVQMLLGPTPQ